MSQSDASIERKFEEIGVHPQLSFLQELGKLLPDAEWFLVGGAVRDIILGRLTERQDFDLVVRGADLDAVALALGTLGKVDYVGRDFGVLKFFPASVAVGAPAVDIAWPRTEFAGGSGKYSDFRVQSDPDLPIIDDLARRDFTVNSMAWDFSHRELLDPFGGMGDLEARVIRAVREPNERFGEDLSRMLRAIRFACELGFAIEPTTWAAIERRAREIVGTRRLEDGTEERLVPCETVAREFAKALRADAVKAVDLLERSGLLFRLAPEFERMSRTPQSPKWHSEGDVWMHTKLALARASGPEFARMFPEERLEVETKVAILLHDVGKPEAMAVKGGEITFYGHDAQGAKAARSIAERLRLSSVPGIRIRPERIEWLVRNHLFPIFVELEHVRKTTLCRYFLNDREAGRQLLQVAFADLSATRPEGGEADASRLRPIMDEVAALERESAKMGGRKGCVTGDEVMEATGLAPGPEIGRLLEELREAQLSGEVSTEEEARAFLKRLAARD